ncbi:MAG: alpha/beta fold hydrolase, partial [Vicinamibacteria bacterium]
MSEKTLLFGKTKSLAGVVTDPVGGRNLRTPPLGFVILNAGIVHHVGPNRIHVKLARRLAEAGFIVM